MKLFLVIVLSYLISPESISNLREAYISQSEIHITNLYKSLKKKDTRTADEECYFAVFECLQAKYSYNPYSKYSFFNDGYNRLNKVIKIHPTNPEYRYHRLMIEKNAPAFLIEKPHDTEDKAVIKKFLNKNHPLYLIMAKAIE